MSPLAASLIGAFCLFGGFILGVICVGWLRDVQMRARCQGCVFDRDPDAPRPELPPAKPSHLRSVGCGAGHDRPAS
jgi:hypothetical protein